VAEHDRPAHLPAHDRCRHSQPPLRQGLTPEGCGRRCHVTNRFETFILREASCAFLCCPFDTEFFGFTFGHRLRDFLPPLHVLARRWVGRFWQAYDSLLPITSIDGMKRKYLFWEIVNERKKNSNLS
jgi:hypothetical protein